MEKAEAHLARLRAYGRPSVITYTSLIGMYASIGNQAGAEALLKEAEESGTAMDASIYTTLLTAYARLGLVPEAHRMLERMESRGLKLDLLAYNGLLNAYVKAREFTRADILLFTEMKRKGIRPNRVSRRAWLCGMHCGCKRVLVMLSVQIAVLAESPALNSVITGRHYNEPRRRRPQVHTTQRPQPFSSRLPGFTGMLIQRN